MQGAYHGSMADLVLVYGMRLLPADEVVGVEAAPVALKNGHQAQVTMHILEGSRERIEAQLRHSIEAFFDFYPEIWRVEVWPRMGQWAAKALCATK